MAGLFSKTLSVAALALFTYYVLRMVLVAMHIFYPTTGIPLLKPMKTASSSTVTHGLAWQEPFEYEASMYVTAAREASFGAGFFNASELVWKVGPQSISQRRIRLEKHLDIAIPDGMVTENGTNLYAVLFVQKAGQSQPHPSTSDPYLAVAHAQLTKARPRVIDKKHALLTDKSSDTDHKRPFADDGDDGSGDEGVWVPHSKTCLHWEIVLDDIEFPEWTIPQDILPYLKISKNKARRKQPYTPILWENPLAARASHWKPLTSRNVVSNDMPLETTSMSIDISLGAVSLGWFRLSNYAYQGLGELSSPRSLVKYSESDVDSLKEMVYEANPTMLAITMVAMALHMLFEFLAYKEDVSFWSSKSDSHLQGISRSSVLMGLASSWISCLYLWDRKHETNVVVLLGGTVGAFVEAWKATKVIKIADLLPFGRKRRSERSNDAEKKATKAPSADGELREKVQREVDKQTAWYMVNLCIPAMIAYAAFSLVYQRHESYISWFLNISLVTVYTLEFIQMWPQLLINHRLKTVDMLPLTAFLYRFLTTFIDDLYALVVPMPLLERIGTLRDDLVFFVLCYQWYKFPRRKHRDSTATGNSSTVKTGNAPTKPAKTANAAKTKSRAKKRDTDTEPEPETED
ncbi:Cleft lip and palate transmembrane protein 1 like protein [Coemansia sp. RSA 1933]|nr:Cleft lip and palate transmembrane protein 1 like protein [Coemansia sp. RSA 1933]